MDTLKTGDSVLKEWYKAQKTQNRSKPFVNNTHLNLADPAKKYDAIVVGAGPAGATAAYFMAKDGLDVFI